MSEQTDYRGLTTRTLKLDKIRPYWNNPRRNEFAIDAVAQSIKDYGYNQPIVVDRDNVIIVGHTRLEALKRLDYKEALCVVDEQLTPEKVRQYRIADNKSGEMAKWNPALLSAELREFEDRARYFTESELASLVEQNMGERDHGPGASLIERSKQKMEHQYEKSTNKSNEGLIAIQCKECDETFWVALENARATQKMDRASKAFREDRESKSNQKGGQE